MKRTLGRRVCDTDTATLLASADTEFLYRTKSGGYFIHTRGPVESIHTLAPSVARKWACHRLAADEYNRLFVGDDASLRITVTISETSKQKLYHMREETALSFF